jgi:hypothetical protein
MASSSGTWRLFVSLAFQGWDSIGSTTSLLQAFTPAEAASIAEGNSKMGHAFYRLFYHFVWATHLRDPHIHRSFRVELLNILSDEVRGRNAHAIRHNAMPDHVHLLVRLAPTIAVSDFVGQVNGATAFRVNRG